MSDTTGKPEEQTPRPRPRIQSLSDLIFGLALSIGALSLIQKTPATPEALFGSIAIFGFSFLILIFVWFRYTEIMSVLPVETGRTRALNTVMLFLVAIEPYLFNQLSFGVNSSNAPALSQEVASATYAVALGAIWSILAMFAHILTIEEKNLVATDLLRKYRVQRNLAIIGSGVFFLSILPIFWTAVEGTSLRYLMWASTFFVRRIGNLYYRRFEKRTSASRAK